MFLRKLSNIWRHHFAKAILDSRKYLMHTTKDWIHIVPISYVTIRFTLWHKPPKVCFRAITFQQAIFVNFFVRNTLSIFESTTRTIWKHYFIKPELKGFFYFIGLEFF